MDGEQIMGVCRWQDYRKDEIKQKLSSMSLRYLDVMVTGGTGSGKSTTLNAIFGEPVATVGTGVDPETQELDSYDLNGVARFWDTPGFGDGVRQDEQHAQKVKELLHKSYRSGGIYYGWIDLVILIIDGSVRDMGSVYALIDNVILPNFQSDRILVAINQADVAKKGRHWDGKKPDATLEEYLREQALSVQRRIHESTGINIVKPVYYSGKYGYNIDKLMDLFIDNMPLERRPLL